MPTNNFRQSVITLVLVALLGAPLTASAAPVGVGISGRGQTSWSSATTWLWRLLLGRVKEGCMIDPFGRCATDSVERIENGCLIDPNGRCVTDAEQTTKEGCSIDPFGRCVPAPEGGGKNGCSIDPFGRCI
jgi:hypothetical protein